ncbi:50S ribosomal protein L3 [Geodia barretti]|uniref:Large ribosomal subunit protein uL3c n=1 Tax=Geodia barretti TaxID=519541 RepID=A0AA35TUF4_GEOBA|nr:50S ribosomal protein L3 [Geodia barretti]
MTRVFSEGGVVEPVSVIEAGPCIVTQVKTSQANGYEAVQEFRVDDLGDAQIGQRIDVSMFEAGDIVNISGVSKGKGFAGGMKRHNFKGGPKTHGQSDRARAPGSVGAGTTPGRVWKGTKMAGHMGNKKVTALNLKVVKVDLERNLLLVRGAVPGARNGMLSVGTIEVNDGLFDVPMNQALVHQVAVAHRANARQGTSATKTRGMVSGGGAKPWRQKHTGRARQGSRRAPQWRGGGIVFGPQPRDYSQRIPKKMNRGAIRCLLSQKVREEKLTVLEGLEFEQPKTKEMVAVLANLGIATPVLVVTPVPQTDIILSARNLPRVKTLPVFQLNPWTC